MAQPYPYPHPHMQQAGPYGTTQAPGPFGMGMGTGIGIGMVQQASTNPTVRGYLNEHMLSVGMGMTESWAGNYGPVAAAFWNSLKMYFAVCNDRVKYWGVLYHWVDGRFFLRSTMDMCSTSSRSCCFHSGSGAGVGVQQKRFRQNHWYHHAQLLCRSHAH
jgi:hypothetical protein